MNCIKQKSAHLFSKCKSIYKRFHMTQRVFVNQYSVKTNCGPSFCSVYFTTRFNSCFAHFGLFIVSWSWFENSIDDDNDVEIPGLTYPVRSIELVVNQPFAANFLEGLQNVRLPSTMIYACKSNPKKWSIHLRADSGPQLGRDYYVPVRTLEIQPLKEDSYRYSQLDQEQALHIRRWEKIYILTDFGVRTCFLYWREIMKAIIHTSTEEPPHRLWG